MTSARIGLFVQDDRLTVIAIAGGGRVEHFVVADAEEPAAKLAAELQARGLDGGRIRIGLDRRPAVVKGIELPRADGGDLARMVEFELERHVPFSPEDTRFDWTELPAGAGEPHRVLAAAVERRVADRPLALLAGARRRPATLTVACHDLLALLPRALRARRVVWAHRHGGVADLLFLDGRTLLTSRQVVAAGVEGLTREITRSWGLAGWSECDAVWLSGDDAPGWRADLEVALRVRVSAPPYAPASTPLIAALPTHGAGAALLALGVAAGPRSPVLNLLPAEARPRTLSRSQLVTAAMVALTALPGLGLALTHVIKTERYVERLTQEIHRLDPEAKTVDTLAAELARKKRLLAAIASAHDDRIQVLPVLREMTETLPPGAWLQAVVMERQGMELTGQADVASPLIPLLESSSRLERVEFTSPVTKTQSKEQFRIRASWERAGKDR